MSTVPKSSRVTASGSVPSEHNLNGAILLVLASVPRGPSAWSRRAKARGHRTYTGIQGLEASSLGRCRGVLRCIPGGQARPEAPASLLEMDDALELLSPVQRQIIVMKAAGYRYREISRALGVSQRNISKAIRAMKEALDL